MVSYKELVRSMGEVIRRRRKAKRWKLKQMAAKADVSLSFLSQIENNTAIPSLEYVHRICEALEISVAQIFALAEVQAQVPSLETVALSKLPSSVRGIS